MSVRACDLASHAGARSTATAAAPSSTRTGASGPDTLLALLHARAGELGDRRLYTFLADGESEAATLSFAGLAREASSLAQALRARIGCGPNVLLAYPSGLEFVVAFFACLEAGLVPVPVCPPHPRRGHERLVAVAADCDARAVLTIDAVARWVAVDRELAALTAIATDAMAPHDSRPSSPSLLPGGEGSLSYPPALPSSPGRAATALPSETLAFLQYTSGSTSAPRGVRITHANVIANLSAIHAAEANDVGSRGVSWLPCYHDMGLIEGILQPLYGGYPTWLMPHSAFLQRPVRWLEAISRLRATVSGGPNFAFDACLRRIDDDQLAALDLHHWRVAYCGAEPVRAETLECFAARFERCGFRARALRPVYGLAEATLLVAASDAQAPRPRIGHAQREALESGRFVAAREGVALVSCGRPQPGTTIAIVDPATGAAVSDGTIGEIWVSGPSVAGGYWSAEHNGEVFRAAAPDGQHAHWLCTGDLGFLLDGELYVSGRRKDLIILRGRKLHPQDIEHTVQALAARRLDGVAAFALPKTEGDAVVVLAELRSASLEAEPAACVALADTIRGEVYRRHDIAIDALGFVRPGSLARTSSGKLMRFRCRQDFIDSRLRLIARFDTPASGLAWRNA
jgi:acyl-CoA synthetase (AMP-forming)/AMP-acid ligase II